MLRYNLCWIFLFRVRGSPTPSKGSSAIVFGIANIPGPTFLSGDGPFFGFPFLASQNAQEVSWLDFTRPQWTLSTKGNFFANSLINQVHFYSIVLARSKHQPVSVSENLAVLKGRCWSEKWANQEAAKNCKQLELMRPEKSLSKDTFLER